MVRKFVLLLLQPVVEAKEQLKSRKHDTSTTPSLDPITENINPKSKTYAKVVLGCWKACLGDIRRHEEGENGRSHFSDLPIITTTVNLV